MHGFKVIFRLMTSQEFTFSNNTNAWFQGNIYIDDITRIHIFQ